MAQVMLELLEFDGAVQMLAKLANRGGLPGIPRRAALAAGREFGTETRFTHAGFLRKVGERGESQIGDPSVLLFQTSEHRQPGNIVGAQRAIEFLFLDGCEDGVLIQQRDAGTCI